MADSQRPRTPGMVYAVATLVLLLIIGTIALTQRQPPPPSIAEFAPQAVDQITESPTDQGSSSGTGKGTGGEAPATAPTPAPEAAKDVPRVRRCVGDPPRQIEDPQSPPCVPFWQGNNGGATTRGVTGNQINVVTVSGDAAAGARIAGDLQAFFNRRFEFYGRQLNFVSIPAADTGGGECPKRKAGVKTVIDKYQAFAIITPSGDDQPCFFEEAARLGLIVVNPNNMLPEEPMTSWDPYVWQYAMSRTEQLQHWGRWVCRRMAGAPASHAADVTMRSARRTFGLLMMSQQAPYLIDTSPIKRELERCGETLAFERVVYAADGADSELYTETQNAIVSMKDKGVTTPLIASGFLSGQNISSAATSQGYFPEWLLDDGFGVNWLVKQSWPDSSQRQSLAAFFSVPEQVAYPDQPLNWALGEVDPEFQMDQSSVLLAGNLNTYRTLLLLASGIQMAGPKLTPQTMRDALHRTRFPNPSVPPLQEGWVGFPQRSHGMIHDAYAAWWREDVTGPYPDDGPGAWCYAEGGRRYALDEWTKGPDELFGVRCDAAPAGL